MTSLSAVLFQESRRPHAVRESPRAHWYVVATVCIGAFMGQLDASIVTLALPQLGRELHAGAGATEWVALAYLLVLVASLAAVGHLADVVGRKLLYVYGFAVFTAGSALCGLAPNLPLLIAARVLQGVGAAMLQANSVALIAEAMPREKLARGYGIQGTAQALGLALGPAVGGALLALGGWRLIFLVNIPAGMIGIVLGWLLLPRSRSHRTCGDHTDRLGTVLLATASGSALLLLSLAQRSSAGLPIACGVACVISAALFVRRERSHPSPLLDLTLLRSRTLALGLGSGVVSYAVLFGALIAVSYHLSVAGVSTATAGIELAILPIAIGISAPRAGRFASTHPHAPLTAIGMLLCGAGLLLATVTLPVGFALAGIGIGAFTPTNNTAVMCAAPGGRTGVISGVLNMTRGLGTALGVAVASLLYVTSGLTVTLSALAAAALLTALVLRR